jgi:hypothetical protein
VRLESLYGVIVDGDDADAAQRMRYRASAEYRPAQVRLLLVAPAPPKSLDRYFYFHDVSTADPLFRYVILALFGAKPDRNDKARCLMRLRDARVCISSISSM